MCADAPGADWHSPAPYAPLAQCDRHGFAWEWLRRTQAYRTACAPQLTAAEEHRIAAQFGLHRLEAPDLAWPQARPLWRRDVDPAVLEAEIAPSPGGTAIDLRMLTTIASFDDDGQEEHWLFADHGHHVRIDLRRGSLNKGCVALRFQIRGFPRCRAQLASLDRLVALTELGRWPARNPPPERRAERWALMLRVHDAVASGASHRAIAERLFELGELQRWRVTAPSWRRRVQRLAEAARQLARAGPATWLRS